MAPTRMKDRNSAWEKKFRQLQLFKAKHGHVNVQHVSETLWIEHAVPRAKTHRAITIFKV